MGANAQGENRTKRFGRLGRRRGGNSRLPGRLIALVFYRCLSATGIWFFLLPIITILFAIAIFSLLLWFVRGWFGIHSHLSSHDELVDILAIYLVYGLISLFAPFVYGFALLAQYAFRVLTTVSKD
jgi:hypothetical protein